MYPGVFGGCDAETQALQPRPLRFIISQGNLKGDVVYRGCFGIESPITETGRSVEKSENLGMTAVTVGDPEKNGVIGSPH